MRPHILIVDDALDQLKLMESVFQAVDPSLIIQGVQSGDEALTRLRSDEQSRPKVMLLDLRMPGKQGLDVLKEIKADPELKKIPVCAFSNGDIPKDVCDCYENGASFYFKKPCGFDELIQFATNFKNIWFKFASHCVN